MATSPEEIIPCVSLKEFKKRVRFSPKYEHRRIYKMDDKGQYLRDEAGNRIPTLDMISDESQQAIVERTATCIYAFAIDQNKKYSLWNLWPNPSEYETFTDVERGVLCHPWLNIVITPGDERVTFDLATNTLQIDMTPLEKYQTNYYELFAYELKLALLEILNIFHFKQFVTLPTGSESLTFEQRAKLYLKQFYEGDNGFLLSDEPHEYRSSRRWDRCHVRSKSIEVINNQFPGNAIEIAMMYAVANGGIVEGQRALKFIGLDQNTEQAAKLRVELYDFSVRIENCPLLATVLSTGITISDHPKIFRKLLTSNNPTLLDLILKTLEDRNFIHDSEFIRKTLTETEADWYLEIHRHNVKLLLEVGLNDEIAKTVTRFAWPQKPEFGYKKFFHEYSGSYILSAHDQLKWLIGLGVNFNIPQVIDWALKDPTADAIELIISNNSEVAKQLIAKGQNDQLVIIAMQADSWKLMRQLEKAGANLNVKAAIKLGLNQGLDRALFVVLESGQVPGFPCATTFRADFERSSWEPLLVRKEWESERLIPFLDLTDEEILRKCGAAFHTSGYFYGFYGISITMQDQILGLRYSQLTNRPWVEKYECLPRTSFERAVEQSTLQKALEVEDTLVVENRHDDGWMSSEEIRHNPDLSKAQTSNASPRYAPSIYQTVGSAITGSFELLRTLPSKISLPELSFTGFPFSLNSTPSPSPAPSPAHDSSPTPDSAPAPAPDRGREEECSTFPSPSPAPDRGRVEECSTFLQPQSRQDKLIVFQYAYHTFKDLCPFSLPWNQEEPLTDTEKESFEADLKSVIEFERAFLDKQTSFAFRHQVNMDKFEDVAKRIEKAKEEITRILRKGKASDALKVSIQNNVTRIEELLPTLTKVDKQLKQAIKKQKKKGK